MQTVGTGRPGENFGLCTNSLHWPGFLVPQAGRPPALLNPQFGNRSRVEAWLLEFVHFGACPWRTLERAAAGFSPQPRSGSPFQALGQTYWEASATNPAFTGLFSMQATMRSISRSSQQEVGFASGNSFQPLQHAAGRPCGPQQQVDMIGHDDKRPQVVVKGGAPRAGALARRRLPLLGVAETAVRPGWYPDTSPSRQWPSRQTSMQAPSDKDPPVLGIGRGQVHGPSVG